MPKRSTDDESILLGVCAGLAHHFNRDATLIRFCFIILVIFLNPVPVLVLYIILAALMENPSNDEEK